LDIDGHDNNLRVLNTDLPTFSRRSGKPADRREGGQFLVYAERTEISSGFEFSSNGYEPPARRAITVTFGDDGHFGVGIEDCCHDADSASQRMLLYTLRVSCAIGKIIAARYFSNEKGFK
jgi:hypothetical protein